MSTPPLTFSFEKDTLVLANTPDPSGLQFARVRSAPPRLKGPRPEVPHPCALDLFLKVSHAFCGVTSSFQILEDTMFPYGALLPWWWSDPSLSEPLLTAFYPDRRPRKVP